MGVSSYTKIAQHLLKTKGFADYKKELREALPKAVVQKYTFQDRGAQVPTITLKAEVPGFMDVDFTDPTKFEISMYKLATSSTLGEVMRSHWGRKECPTYNCKFDKATTDWVNTARDTLSFELKTEIAEAQEQIRAQGIALLEKVDLAAERKEFHDRIIVERIKRVLLEFKDVATAEIYKLALDEFVAHEIMES